MLLGWRDKGRISFQAASIRHVMLGAALVVPKDVLENDEKPSPEICPRLPGVDIGDRSREAFLDEVVRIIRIAGHIASEAAQPRDFRLHSGNGFAIVLRNQLYTSCPDLGDIEGALKESKS
jgi:hypothetical protein